MRYLISILFIVLTAPGLVQADMPKRKPGLWEIKMTSDASHGGGPMVSQHCIDAKTDDLLQQRTQGMGKQACSKNSVRSEGGRLVAEAVCKIGNSTATTRAVFSGNFGSDYRGEIHTTYQPPTMGMKESHQKIEARWLGPCKPGQKPGDVIMPGAGTFNVPDLIQKLPYLLPR